MFKNFVFERFLKRNRFSNIIRNPKNEYATDLLLVSLAPPSATYLSILQLLMKRFRFNC